MGSDGSVGWLTIRGNKGTPFLQDADKPFMVAMEETTVQDKFSEEPWTRVWLEFMKFSKSWKDLEKSQQASLCARLGDLARTKRCRGGSRSPLDRVSKMLLLGWRAIFASLALH